MVATLNGHAFQLLSRSSLAYGSLNPNDKIVVSGCCSLQPDHTVVHGIDLITHFAQVQSDQLDDIVVVFNNENADSVHPGSNSTRKASRKGHYRLACESVYTL